MKTRYKDKHDNPIYTGDIVWVEWDDISYEGVIEEEGGMIVCDYYDIGEREPLPLKWFPKCKRDILTEKEARRYWKTAMLGDEPPVELYRKEIYRNESDR